MELQMIYTANEWKLLCWMNQYAQGSGILVKCVVTVMLMTFYKYTPIHIITVIANI